MDRFSYDVAKKLAHELLGKDLVELTNGRNNWVFKFGRRIISIPRHERVKNYSIRVAANRFLKSNGVKVPEIIAYSPKSNDQPEYLVVETIDGGNVKLSDLDLRERNRVHFSAGKTLRSIHQLKLEGYGRVDEDLTGTSKSWREFIDGYFRESLGRVVLSSEIADKYAHTLELEYNSSVDIAMNSPSNFLHSDFHIGNLLFDKLTVSGVLDLDLVTSGDPAWDTGHYIHTFNLDRANGAKAFREGYGERLNPEKERLYCLMIWARKVGSQAIQRPEALKETIPELEKILGGEE